MSTKFKSVLSLGILAQMLMALFFWSRLRADCPSYVNFVSFTTRRISGLGHCDGEVVGFFTNHSNMTMSVSVLRFSRQTGRWEIDSGGDIGPGRTDGGEMGGYYWCHVPIGEVFKYSVHLANCTK
jgi:hypothetical protein